MNVTFDPAKGAANSAKHGLPLSMASELEWESALIWPDRRRDYGEQRMCGLLPKDDRLYFVAFVERGESLRIISLRKANEREVQTYVENS
jgi:uncharacterized DUF497 family protein